MLLRSWKLLRNEKLYANLMNCMFCMGRVIFLGIVGSAREVKVYGEKVKVIKNWLTLKLASKVRHFHGME